MFSRVQCLSERMDTTEHLNGRVDVLKGSWKLLTWAPRRSNGQSPEVLRALVSLGYGDQGSVELSTASQSSSRGTMSVA